MTDAIPTEVLAAYGFAPEVEVELVARGLINRTFYVDHHMVLQKLHPIFGPEVNLDIEAITTRLAEAGLATPRLVRTHDGRAWVEHEGETWRALSRVTGSTVDRMPTPASARSAGALVGRFHRALAGVRHDFRFVRAGVHDTARHLAILAERLATDRGHRSYDAVEPIARTILERGSSIQTHAGLPRRIIHGDLKVSNVVFDESGAALALIDLDTLQNETLAVELGDALRSWCNPHAEDAATSGVDVAIFEAAVHGYATVARDALTAVEARSIVSGFERIALELASRFCADALAESYFRWDRERFSSATEHNLSRARSQLALVESIAGSRVELERIAAEAFGGKGE
jgi:Ser/Thr protein kinase RdoA (MazF antagonist)